MQSFSDKELDDLQGYISELSAPRQKICTQRNYKRHIRTQLENIQLLLKRNDITWAPQATEITQALTDLENELTSYRSELNANPVIDISGLKRSDVVAALWKTATAYPNELVNNKLDNAQTVYAFLKHKSINGVAAQNVPVTFKNNKFNATAYNAQHGHNLAQHVITQLRADYEFEATTDIYGNVGKYLYEICFKK